MTTNDDETTSANIDALTNAQMKARRAATMTKVRGGADVNVDSDDTANNQQVDLFTFYSGTETSAENAATAPSIAASENVNDETDVLQLLYNLDEEVELEDAQETADTNVAAQQQSKNLNDHARIRSIGFDNPEEERNRAAAALVHALGAASQPLTNDWNDLSRLAQIALLGISGDSQLARRVVAGDVVRALPDFATVCLEFAEARDLNEAEKFGLRLVGLIDQRAFIGETSKLHEIGTCVLMTCLRWPFLRDEFILENRALIVSGISARHREFSIRGPLPQDALQHKIAYEQGLVPLPFATSRVSIAHLALRTAAALRENFGSRHVLSVDTCARLEHVCAGFALMIAGVAPRLEDRDLPLPSTAYAVAKRELLGIFKRVQKDSEDALRELRRALTEKMKKYKDKADDALTRLEIATSALARHGFDETGEPFSSCEDKPATELTDSIIVCPPVPNANAGKIKDAVLGHEHMLGKPVDLVLTGDLTEKRQRLIAEFPFASEVIDFILADLANRSHVTIRPVLLTGTPGSGKTHFVRRFADIFGLHLWSVDCGGTDGSVFSGTDRRWSSAEPSHPFLAMSRGKQANPMVLLDEIEKAPARQDYGRLWDSLLPFLDSGSNKAVQDRCLQVPIDGSHINYIATANSIGQLPWPLRDRLRIKEFPEPARDHIDALLPSLLKQLADTRGVDARFIPPLTPEEHAFLKRKWRGGSVRRLARLLEAVVNAREAIMRRH